jgi:hypothetical protein
MFFFNIIPPTRKHVPLKASAKVLKKEIEYDCSAQYFYKQRTINTVRNSKTFPDTTSSTKETLYFKTKLWIVANSETQTKA